MLLGVLERILLDNLLPKEGGYLTMILVDEFRKCLRLTPEEITEFELVEGVDEDGRKTGSLHWNKTKAKDIEVEVGEATMKIVKDTLTALSDAGKVTIDHLSLCKKFEISG